MVQDLQKQTIKLEVKINYPKMSGIQIELE